MGVHQGEDEERLTVHVRTLTGLQVLLQVLNSSPAYEIRRLLLQNTECCYITHYKLVTDCGAEINDYLPLNRQSVKVRSLRKLNMVFYPYDPRNVREHISHVRALLTSPIEDITLTRAIVEDLVTADTKRAFSYPSMAQELGFSTAFSCERCCLGSPCYGTLVDDSEPLCANSLDAEVVRSAVSSPAQPLPTDLLITLSPCDPPPSRRLRGDIWVLKFVSPRGEWHALSTTTGFHLIAAPEGGTYDPKPLSATSETLIGLIASEIPGEWKLYKKLVSARLNCMAAEPPVPNMASRPQWLITQEPVPVADRWNTVEASFTEIQPHDPRVPPREWIVPHESDEVETQIIHDDFVSASATAVQMAVDGTLEPFLDRTVPLEQQVFVYDGILLKFCGGESWGLGRKEVVMTRFLKTVWDYDSMALQPVCCVDYLGYRVLCYNATRDEIEEIMGMRARKVVDTTSHAEGNAAMLKLHQQWGHVLRVDDDGGLNHRCRVLEGTDQRLYMDNPAALLPDDPEGKKYRAELLVSLTRHRPSHPPSRLHESFVSTAHDNDSSCGTNELASDTLKRDDSSESEGTRPDAPLDDALHSQIEALIGDLLSGTKAPGDGKQLTDLLHERGIPMRALGEVYCRVGEKPWLRRLILLERTARCAKHELHRLWREHRGGDVSTPTAQFLNNLIAKPLQHDSECGDPISVEPWSLVRRVCAITGVRLGPKAEVGQLSPNDIADIVPLTFHRPEQHSQQPLQQQPPERARKHIECASRAHSTGDTSGALMHLRLAVHYGAKALGWDSPELIPLMHSLARLNLHSGKVAEAARIYARCAVVAYLGSGGRDTPDYLASMTNYAHALQRQGRHKEAVRILSECLPHFPPTSPTPNRQAAQIHFNLGASLMQLSSPSEALPHLLTACNAFTELYGFASCRLAESSKILSTCRQQLGVR